MEEPGGNSAAFEDPCQEKRPASDNRKRRYCKHCGGLIDGKMKQCVSCGKQYFRFSKTVVLVMTLIVMLLTLVGLNIYQYTRIAALDREVYHLEDKATYYDEICDFFRSGNIGYASNNFKASDSVVVIDKYDKSKKITLTAAWRDGGRTVSASNSNLAPARIRFDRKSWSRTTTMTITPYIEGISVITFSNSVNSDTFKILIIVTEILIKN